MRPTIFVTTSKGDNLKIREVVKIRSTSGKALIIESIDAYYQNFDKIMRDRDIELVNVEVEDIGI